METFKISREWLNRMGLILFFFIGSAGWFFYDGLIAYPRNNEIFDARETLEKAFPQNPAALEAAWEKTAAEKGYPTDKEKLPDRRKNSGEQLKWGFGLLAIAALFALFIIRDAFRKIKTDEKSFTGINAVPALFATLKTVNYNDVIGVDKSRWDKKGIAKIIYKTAANAPHQAVFIDDYKYAGTEKILIRCEETVAAKIAAKAEKNESV